MGELWGFMTNVGSHAGQFIVDLIGLVFAVGLGILIWRIFHVYFERWQLIKASEHFRGTEDTGSLEQLQEVVVPSSLVYRRIRDILSIQELEGQVDQDALAEIAAGKESIKGSFVRYILGALIVLGLIGTLWGFSHTISEVQYLIGGPESMQQLDEMRDSILKTLQGMHTAFATTLAGLVSSLFLGAINVFFNRQRTLLLAELEEFTTTVFLPRLTRLEADSIEQAIDSLGHASKTLQFATDQSVAMLQSAVQQLIDIPWEARLEQQYALVSKLEDTSENLLKSLNDIGNFHFMVKDSVNTLRDVIQRSQTQTHEVQTRLAQALETALPDLAQEAQSLQGVLDQYKGAQASFAHQLGVQIHAHDSEHVDLVQRMISRTQADMTQTISAFSKVIAPLSTAIRDSQDLLASAQQQHSADVGTISQQILESNETMWRHLDNITIQMDSLAGEIRTSREQLQATIDTLAARPQEEIPSPPSTDLILDLITTHAAQMSEELSHIANQLDLIYRQMQKRHPVFEFAQRYLRKLLPSRRRAEHSER